MKKLLLFLPLLLPLGACGNEFTEGECNLNERNPAISLLVVDAADDGPLPVESLATFRTDNQSSQVVIPPNTTTPEEYAMERWGFFDVSVEAEGYEAWDTTDVHVTQDEGGCTVETADLTARMRPAE